MIILPCDAVCAFTDPDIGVRTWCTSALVTITWSRWVLVVVEIPLWAVCAIDRPLRSVKANLTLHTWRCRRVQGMFDDVIVMPPCRTWRTRRCSIASILARRTDVAHRTCIGIKVRVSSHTVDAAHDQHRRVRVRSRRRVLASQARGTRGRRIVIIVLLTSCTGHTDKRSLRRVLPRVARNA